MDNIERPDAPYQKESLSGHKPMYSLIEPAFKKDMAEVLTIGAQKYALENWKKCPDKRLYVDALLRHTEAYLAGEYLDQETGKPHLAHAACNLMFLHWMEEDEKQSSNS